MELTTRERILKEALVQFSEKGYEGTNLRDLATCLNLSKSALYRHYDSKEAIWNELVKKATEYYDKRFGSVEHLPEIPKDVKELEKTCMKMVEFTTGDKEVLQFRKLIQTNQFRDPHIAELATCHFITNLENIFTEVFREMMKNGALRQGDPQMLAFSFTTPISALIQFVDREPDKEKEAMKKIKAFIHFFGETYGTGKKDESGKKPKKSNKEKKTAKKEKKK